MIDFIKHKNEYVVEYIHNINFNNNMSNNLDYYINNIDVIKIDYNLNSLELLKIEDELIFYLHKYCLKTHEMNNDFIIKMLNLILNISQVLKKRVKLPDFNLKFNEKKKNELKRCSYKFCKFKENCNYNYCKKKCVCYQDHYVHHMVSYDITQILNYLQNIHSVNNILSINNNMQSINNNMQSINNNMQSINSNINNTHNVNHTEILKSIKTLAFVINHMKNELSVKCLYCKPNEIERNHIVNIDNIVKGK